MAKTMDKEFVTYEVALALKELGFEYEKFYNYTSPMTNLAPLKQQVFRWFREKYGLFGWVEGKEGKRIYMYRIESPIDSDDQLNCFPFKTYEEAENAAIDKLIEIAKQQDK
jgi:hypothetical protein